MSRRAESKRPVLFPSHIDLTDPRAHAEGDLDGGGLFAALRLRAPVSWHGPTGSSPGFWVVTRYDDVLACYRDPARFTSVHGNVLGTLTRGGDSASGLMLPVSDGSRHLAVRRRLLPALLPRALPPVTAAIQEAVRRLLADAIDRERVDFAGDVAAQVPLGAICQLLDVPESDRAFIFANTSAALAAEEPDQPAADAQLAQSELLLYFAKLARERQEAPGADVVSLLATSEIDGEPLTEPEIVMNCYSLVLGGDETARLAMIGGVRELAAQPDEWKRLRSGEVDLDTAVEEVLRWTTPAMHAGRTVTEDTMLGGQRLPAGDVVTLWNSSANRDEQAFPAPERFDLARQPNRHLTFGHGPHFCLGAHLARVELRCLLETLREWSPSIELAAEPRPIYSNFLTGYSSLPLYLRR